jgi:predicted class III extradiol MEMO1 family dioxygenase
MSINEHSLEMNVMFMVHNFRIEILEIVCSFIAFIDEQIYHLGSIFIDLINHFVVLCHLPTF